MVGGIHTVLASKARAMLQKYGDNYIAIGPNLNSPNLSSVFREEIWQPAFIESLSAAGINCRMGRWLIPSEPRCLLVDFNHLQESRDKILFEYWEKYRLHSLFGAFDYHEPMCFGQAVGILIDHIYHKHLQPKGDTVVVQCHEWMASAPILYLRSSAPEIGTVFTTHATMLGRSISGNQREVNAAEMSPPKLERLAHELGVSAKHSMETISAKLADCFTTVSETTADECADLLGRRPDQLLFNALSEEFPDAHLAEGPAVQHSRNRLFEIAELVTGQTYDRKNTHLFASSGRYEFRNKGIDLFIDALGKLNVELKGKTTKKAVAFFMFPAGHLGPRPAFLNRQHLSAQRQPQITTHELRDEAGDPNLIAFKNAGLSNRPDDPIHIVFLPIYLDGSDPLIPEKYYELLPGVDISVFASFYEPWGYTPMESVAFGVPTITSDLAGFGQWARKLGEVKHTGVVVLERKNKTFEEASNKLKEALRQYLDVSERFQKRLKRAALNTASKGRWKQLASIYFEAHDLALEKATQRVQSTKQSGVPSKERPKYSGTQHMRNFFVLNRTPKKLEKLRTLARNFWFTWNPKAIKLLSDLDPSLWAKCHSNPSIFLDYVQPEVIEKAAASEAFLQKLDQVYATFLEKTETTESPSIAFFCVEYGLTSFFKLYSGGLGILAGDILKTASDMKLPFCAVGLAYSSGYFQQVITREGNQESHYVKNDFYSLPIELVRTKDGQPLIVSVPFPSHPVHVRAWKVAVGAINLYLLDTDFGANKPKDRAITNALYGGDPHHRIRQEFILGLGGLKMLKALGISPSVYHMNEGHSAFLVLARLVEMMTQENLSFDEALEFIRHTSVFTTHTPVAAGHDHFSEEIIRPLLSPFGEAVQKDWSTLFNLGKNPNPADKDFSMTYLCLRGSMWVNGVSEVHGKVSRKMFHNLYPGFHEFEVPIKSITNGVHIPTWLAPEWQTILSRELDEDWKEHLVDPEYWEKVKEIESETIWHTHMKAKERLIHFLKGHIEETFKKRRENPAHMVQAFTNLDNDPLLIAFARRFAPYKRAGLLFHNPKKLEELLSGDRPTMILFAGKAHPSDTLGQELIKRVIEFSRLPAFAGKIVFLENYEIEMAQLLVAGSDIWLNTPTRPLEASGTSGMKAAINGCLNLSVSDGWWVEGYNGKNGWSIEDSTDNPEDFQTEYDSAKIYALLEHQVIPMFRNRNDKGVPEEWVKMMKESISWMIPRFSARRMLRQYQQNFYEPAIRSSHLLSAERFSGLKKLCGSKRRLSQRWHSVAYRDVQIEGLDTEQVLIHQPIGLKVELEHPDLTADDLLVQAVLRRKSPYGQNADEFKTLSLKNKDKNGTGSSRWETEVVCSEAGPYELGLRVVPRGTETDSDAKLLHGLVKWL